MAPLGTSISKLPSRSVAVPILVPETMTAAPMTGNFSESVTTPVTLMFWADSIEAPRTRPASTTKSRLSRLLVFIIVNVG